MDLEKGRNIWEIMILIAAVIAYWVNLLAGLALTIFVEVMTAYTTCDASTVVERVALRKNVSSSIPNFIVAHLVK